MKKLKIAELYRLTDDFQRNSRTFFEVRPLSLLGRISVLCGRFKHGWQRFLGLEVGFACYLQRKREEVTGALFYREGEKK
jgi:hypothetical protein